LLEPGTRHAAHHPSGIWLYRCGRKGYGRHGKASRAIGSRLTRPKTESGWPGLTTCEKGDLLPGLR
jgi:hypothetical protein